MYLVMVKTEYQIDSAHFKADSDAQSRGSTPDSLRAPGPGGPGSLPTRGSHRPVRARIRAYGSSDHGFADDPSDSGRTADTRPSRCSSVAPGQSTTKAPAKGLSKLNSMAFGLAVYASQCALPRPTQDSLPAAGQALPDGLSTRKVPMKGFRFASYISSPFPKLLGAMIATGADSGTSQLASGKHTDEVFECAKTGHLSAEHLGHAFPQCPRSAFPCDHAIHIVAPCLS